jgi:hypothetical protein
VNDLMDAMGALSIPREQLFKMLGSKDGSGSALLQALGGIDPESAGGRYGGLAAEIAGDPLNLLTLGGSALAGAGVKGLQAARRAGQVGELGAALAAGGRVARASGGQLAALSEDALSGAGQLGDLRDLRGLGNSPIDFGAFRGPGGFPHGMGDILPEAADVLPGHAMPASMKAIGGADARAARMGMLGDIPPEMLAKNPRGLPDYVEGLGGMGDPVAPQYLSGYKGKQYGNSQVADFTDQFGAPGMARGANSPMSQFRAADFARNAEANQAMAAGTGAPADDLFRLLGADAGGVAERMQMNPELAAAILGDRASQQEKLPALLAALRDKMGALQAAPIDPMLSNLATMGLGGAAGGRMGTQAIQGYRKM